MKFFCTLFPRLFVNSALQDLTKKKGSPWKVKCCKRMANYQVKCNIISCSRKQWDSRKSVLRGRGCALLPYPCQVPFHEVIWVPRLPRRVLRRVPPGVGNWDVGIGNWGRGVGSWKSVVVVVVVVVVNWQLKPRKRQPNRQPKQRNRQPKQDQNIRIAK